MKEPLHPVHQTHDGYFNTFSGKKISIHEPKADMIDINDIAHALSNLCRFGGHTSSFYSVAQHSILVQKLAYQAGESPEVVFAALMHDATEAYVHDIIKPLKRILGEKYEEVETRFESVLCQKYRVAPADIKAVKPYDRIALEIEHACFFKKEQSRFFELFPEGIHNNRTSRMKFLHQFKRLENILKEPKPQNP